MKKMTVRNSGITKREDVYKIDPKEIVVDLPENLRSADNYFDNEVEKEEFKNSIKQYGVLQPIELYINQETQKFHLSHGFRRLTTVLELIDEGFEIEFIKFNVVADNQEERLIKHYILNNGRKLTPYEMAIGFQKLKAFGYNTKEISEKTSIDYQRVNYLLNFVENASHQLKESVRKQEISLQAARTIVETSTNQEQQNIALNEAKDAAIEIAVKSGKDTDKVKVKTSNIAKRKEKQSTFEKTLRSVVETAESNSDLDPNKVQLFKQMFDLISNGGSVDDIAAQVFAKTESVVDIEGLNNVESRRLRIISEL